MTEHIPNLAVFVDYDNVAIGARDARYGSFDVHLILERLLEKGKVIVKKAYADWARFEAAKKGMHSAAFELIEIPKTSYSGKNSADIRLVVDALDLCYTKTHVDLVVIISGDSDFSPLVSKLRENGKTVVGVGVKSSTSNLLVENCDEFIYYDDLVRQTRKASKGRRKPAAEGAKETSAASKGDKQQEVLDLVMETVEALFRDREDTIWGSHVKQVIKRKQPHFSESYFGFRSFNDLLETARDQGLLEIEKDQRSGGYRILEFGPKAEA
ncbi:MAG: NYN domain-containing protein [Planctomycetota bacterium]|nr:NYN domain-containing protein [Planctomycetota bacterium]